MDQKRAAQLQSLELDAEVLAAHQLDLVAQLECQLRAVHRTMRQIERLRSAKKRRVGPDLSNGEKTTTLNTLAEELTAIDQELDTQHQSCEDMQVTVAKMREQLRAMSRIAAPAMSSPKGESPSQPQS